MATVAQKATKRAYTRAMSMFDLPVTAVANTDFIFSIPANAKNVTYRTYTTTAYTASTDATIAIGSSAGGAQYVAATTIKAVGVKSHTPVDAQAASHLSHPGTLYVRVAQTGTATAVGAGTLCVEYSLPTA
jgi:hypothetical protein